MSVIGKTSALGVKIDPGSTQNQFRSRRFAIFRSMIADVLSKQKRCSILDVGGTPTYWDAFGSQMPDGVSVTVANLFDSVPESTGYLRFEYADACAMPYEDGAFDLIHSNSVIEHVGLFREQAKMAREIRRVAPRYFVQTPNFWFPVEPHCRTLMFHWLPEPIRASMLMQKDRGFWRRAENIGEATESLQEAILLDHRQVAHLFPDAEIFREKWYGLTKSLVAIRR